MIKFVKHQNSKVQIDTIQFGTVTCDVIMTMHNASHSSAYHLSDTFYTAQISLVFSKNGKYSHPVQQTAISICILVKKN